jgi:predicted TIM-barrel fold metal-dependent hydrolase
LSIGGVERIRGRLSHPVIDSDGHCVEYLPAVEDCVREVAGREVAGRFHEAIFGLTRWREFTPDQRRQIGFTRPPWWALPARNTLDRATAMLPRLLHERMEEIGLDFAVVYPTYGLFALSFEDEELRRAACRGVNHYLSEVYAEFSDRLAAVAVIPMHTPNEAIEELDHAVRERRLHAAVLAGHVFRAGARRGELAFARMDCFGIDSEYDYDPVWARCRDLAISPTFHSSGMGWGSRASISSYVHNHLGSFAAAAEAVCRALFLGGVPVRFPELRFAFLEGGVGWACSLFSDLVGHFEKRSRGHLDHYDPHALDHEGLRGLLETYGPERLREHRARLDEGLRVLSDPAEDVVDEFAASGVHSVEEIRDVFVRSFLFGCEADDRLNAAAFNSRVNPLGARLRAMFSSDIGHWDVPDMREVLPEAWSLVEDGVLSTQDFRDFVFANPVWLWAGTNPDFFRGSAVEADVARLLRSWRAGGDRD